jgi:hypothetical protein
LKINFKRLEYCVGLGLKVIVAIVGIVILVYVIVIGVEGVAIHSDEVVGPVGARVAEP